MEDSVVRMSWPGAVNDMDAGFFEEIMTVETGRGWPRASLGPLEEEEEELASERLRSLAS